MIIQIEPWIDKEDFKEVIEAIKSTWVTEHDKYRQFSEEIRKISSVKYALVVDHGTNALYLALLALGIGSGDEVIVPDITFAATAIAVVRVGAKPIFVDVEPSTLINIDVSKIEEKITNRTKAIMPVHLYGLAADMGKIIKIAKKYKLAVIEDAAQGIGVKFQGMQVGTFGDVGIYSFYGNKTITTGEGGALITNKRKIYQSAEQYAHEGRKKGSFIHQKIGFNFHMTELQAALGLSQIKKLPIIIDRKQQLNFLYQQLLADIPEVKFSEVVEQVFPTFWFTNIFVPNATKLSLYLKEKGIQTRRIFYPLHLQPCFRQIVNNISLYPLADKSYRTGLSLPSSVTLKNTQIKLICRAIKEFFK